MRIFFRSAIIVIDNFSNFFLLFSLSHVEHESVPRDSTSFKRRFLAVSSHPSVDGTTRSIAGLINFRPIEDVTSGGGIIN